MKGAREMDRWKLVDLMSADITVSWQTAGGSHLPGRVRRVKDVAVRKAALTGLPAAGGPGSEPPRGLA